MKKPRGSKRGCLFLCVLSRFVAAVRRKRRFRCTPLTLATLETGWCFICSGGIYPRSGCLFVCFLKVRLTGQTAGYGDGFSLSAVSSPVPLKLTVTADNTDASQGQANVSSAQLQFSFVSPSSSFTLMDSNVSPQHVIYSLAALFVQYWHLPFSLRNV